jgi:protein phosphatase 1 regulatory subunit 7
LKILSIQSNRLTRLEGLDSLLNLQEVYVSHNALTEISGLDNNVVYPIHAPFLFLFPHETNSCRTQTSLHVLDISNNQISNLVNIAHLKNLEELWASNNKLSSFEEVERELRDKEGLNTVYFEGNPLQLSNRVTYRNKMRLTLPQVMQIDASKLILPRARETEERVANSCDKKIAFVRVS